VRLLAAILLTSFVPLVSSAVPATTSAQPGWTLVWSDEFNDQRIDRTKWSQDVDCWGGGNGEHQCYTRSARNAGVEEGKLVITARPERVVGPALPENLRRSSPMPDATAVREMSSARLTTHHKASWRYGRFEIHARLPQGQGTWPAIWLLPENDLYGGWAASGEIDILEAVNLGVPCGSCQGGRENTILGTLHYGGKWPKNQHKGEEVAFPEVLDGNFHTYAIEWYPDRMIWQMDGRTFAERRASEWSTTGSNNPGAPFDQAFYLIVNLAIGGQLPESRGVGGVRLDGYPKRMEIDWIRVWQNRELTPASSHNDQRRPRH
jgi:beta-glucanase (GH16 family)